MSKPILIGLTDSESKVRPETINSISATLLDAKAESALKASPAPALGRGGT